MIDTSNCNASYAAKGLAQSGGDNVDWAPLPQHRYRMQVEGYRVIDPSGPPRRNADGTEQKQYQRVRYVVCLPEDDAKRLKEKTAGRLADGQQQSTTAWASFNYTWGFRNRQGQFQPSKLFTFVATCGGFLVKRDLERWLELGGILDPAWFLGMVFRGVVEHQPREGGGVWVNVTPQSLDNAEQANRTLVLERLRLADSALFEQLVGADAPASDDKDDELF